jgi:hypothetical protein
MKKKNELFNTVEFVKYKALVIQIVGAEDWKKASAFYTKRYREFDAFRGGYAKIMQTVSVVKKSVDQVPNQSTTAKAKHLNKTLTAGINLLKSDGFPRVNSKEYKVHESDIKEFMTDTDIPEYGKKEKK